MENDLTCFQQHVTTDTFVDVQQLAPSRSLFHPQWTQTSVARNHSCRCLQPKHKDETDHLTYCHRYIDKSTVAALNLLPHQTDARQTTPNCRSKKCEEREEEMSSS